MKSDKTLDDDIKEQLAGVSVALISSVAGWFNSLANKNNAVAEDIRNNPRQPEDDGKDLM